MQIIFQPALPFIPDKKDEIKLPSAKERKDARKNFLKEEHSNEVIEDSEPKILQRSDDYIEHEGRKILIFMEERIAEAREWLKYARSPPSSSNPYRQKEIVNEVTEFLTSGIYVLSKELIHYIETLIYYAKTNENMFGSYNYMQGEIVVEIYGAKQIKEKLEECEKNNAPSSESLTWFSRLINVCSRPLSVHEELVRQKIYQRSYSNSGMLNSQERSS